MYRKFDCGKTVKQNKQAKIAEYVNTIAGTRFTAEKYRLKVKSILEKNMRDKKKNSLSVGMQTR